MVNFSEKDNVAIITIDKPKYNILGIQEIQQITEVITKIDTDDNLLGVVITGSNDYFCSGFNISELLAFKTRKDVVAFMQTADKMLHTVFACNKPVVAALNGSTIAAGFILAMAADYRFAAYEKKIQLGLSEVKFGLSLCVLHTEIIKFALTEQVFKSLAYEGDLINIQQADAKQVIDQIVAKESLLDYSIEKIIKINSYPGQPFKHIKTANKMATMERLKKIKSYDESCVNFNVFENADTIKLLKQINHKMSDK